MGLAYLFARAADTIADTGLIKAGNSGCSISTCFARSSQATRFSRKPCRRFNRPAAAPDRLG